MKSVLHNIHFLKARMFSMYCSANMAVFKSLQIKEILRFN